MVVQDDDDAPGALLLGVPNTALMACYCLCMGYV